MGHARNPYLNASRTLPSFVFLNRLKITTVSSVVRFIAHTPFCGRDHKLAGRRASNPGEGFKKPAIRTNIKVSNEKLDLPTRAPDLPFRMPLWTERRTSGPFFLVT